MGPPLSAEAEATFLAVCLPSAPCFPLALHPGGRASSAAVPEGPSAHCVSLISQTHERRRPHGTWGRGPPPAHCPALPRGLRSRVRPSGSSGRLAGILCRGEPENLPVTRACGGALPGALCHRARPARGHGGPRRSWCPGSPAAPGVHVDGSGGGGSGRTSSVCPASFSPPTSGGDFVPLSSSCPAPAPTSEDGPELGQRQMAGRAEPREKCVRSESGPPL